MPPNRPSSDNEKLLSAAAAALPKHRKAAILGATPEYRIVLRAHFDEVYILDRCPEFIEISDRLCGREDSDHIRIGEWEELLSDMPGQFDLIASHFTHGNVPFAQRSRLFRAISRALVPQGVFFDTVFHPRGHLFTTKEVVDEFSHRAISMRTLNDLSCAGVFLSELTEELGYVDSTAAYERLLSARHQQHFEQAVELTAKLITPRGARWDYHPDLPPDELGYSECLKAELVIPRAGEGLFAQCTEVHLMRRRDSVE
jgi:SAM-dependent methyltransferase